MHTQYNTWNRSGRKRLTTRANITAAAIVLTACSSAAPPETTRTSTSEPTQVIETPPPSESASVDASTPPIAGTASEDGGLDLSAAEEACLDEVAKYSRPVTEDLPADATFEEYEAALEQRKRDLKNKVWMDTPACRAAEEEN